MQTTIRQLIHAYPQQMSRARTDPPIGYIVEHCYDTVHAIHIGCYHYNYRTKHTSLIENLWNWFEYTFFFWYRR